MNHVQTVLSKFWNDESGQDLIEYALVAGLVGLSCIASMGSVATSIGSTFTSIGTALTNAV